MKTKQLISDIHDQKMRKVKDINKSFTRTFIIAAQHSMKHRDTVQKLKLFILENILQPKMNF